MTTNPSPFPAAGAATSAPAAAPTPPPLRLVLTILELAAQGLIGWGVIGMFAGTFATGVGLTFVFGIGLVLLVGLVYALFGVGWFEIARLNGLYGFDLPALRLRPREAPGFGGWLRSLGRQAIDGRM